jgi:hypothetical protein
VTFYKIKQIKQQVATHSMTAPIRGTLDVVLKQDGENSPSCVYNEMVALRLAHRLGIPVAMGVPSVGDGGIYFASLTVGGLSINLPNVGRRRMPGVAKRYPNAAAAIFVFDVWILNNDRENNLKANLTSAPTQIIAAIDHEQTLLGTKADPAASIVALSNMDFPTNHPLGNLLKISDVERWAVAVSELSDEAISDAVVLGYSVGGIHASTQNKLSDALIDRRDDIAELINQTIASC